MNHAEHTLIQECAREPIHLLGRTQRFGVMLAFDSRQRIVAASANARAWCGEPAARLLGQDVLRVLPRASVDAARAHARIAAARDAAQHLYGVAWPGRSAAVDVSIHQCRGLVFVEAEPAAIGPADAALTMERCTRELATATRMEDLAESAARAVAQLTGYDRVMVYRFAADDSGTVIAEHRAGDQMASYLGLRYPASDIPPQARALYLRNPTRVIADAHDDGLPLAQIGTDPLDLSLATLRSVSPVHLQYLRNMGTAASMSISLVMNGRLWGLIACHHRTPMLPSLACRSAAELLGRLYGMAFARAERHRLDRDLKSLLLAPPGVEPLVDARATPAQRDAAFATMGRLFGATGVITHIEGETRTWGQTLAPASIDETLAALAQSAHREVLPVESLQSLAPALARLAPAVAGLLALPLSRQGRDWVLLLRDEVERHVTWAGDPHKPVQRLGGRLTPRGSFTAWRTSVRGHCEPWTLAEVELAEALRTRLLEVLVTRREQRELELTRRSEHQQALLVRELNHRVRNMLGLIKGLVHQTARGATTIEDLTERLHDRVHALSRAYTQIEKSRWQPTPLAMLVSEETRAFCEPGQVEIGGDAVCLEPNAYLSFALVIHELATNARKYGALSVPQGRLQVNWALMSEGPLQIDWLESGGPAVAPPTHRGFGTRVIGQALSHHLRGKATLHFLPTGLQARLIAPRGFMAGPPAAAQQPHSAGPPPRLAPGAVPRSVLVVEDDLVIAMLAEALLQQLGCNDIVIAGTPEDALDILDRRLVDVALLDVNLGEHTSAGVAQRLAALGVPAVVATGYSESEQLPDSLRGLPHICKPYDRADLERALAAAMA